MPIEYEYSLIAVVNAANLKALEKKLPPADINKHVWNKHVWNQHVHNGIEIGKDGAEAKPKLVISIYEVEPAKNAKVASDHQFLTFKLPPGTTPETVQKAIADDALLSLLVKNTVHHSVLAVAKQK